MVSITWGPANGLSLAVQAQLDAVVNSAAQYINSFLARPIDFDVYLTARDLPGTPLALGNGDIVTTGNANWVSVGEYEARSGIERDGYDCKIQVDSVLAPSMFYDPTPATADDVPPFQVDAFSVIVHEMLHGVCFNAFTDGVTLTNTVGAWFPMDDRLLVIGGKPYFDGPNVESLLGGPVALEPNNISHVSEAAYHADIMSPIADFGRGQISDLDLAMMADMGIGTVRDDLIQDRPEGEIVDGGDGFDQFLIADAGAAFVCLQQGDGSFALLHTSDGTVDDLFDFERVEFADSRIALDLDGTDGAGAAYRIYQAAFDRAPDIGGLTYWVEQADKGMSTIEMSARFIDSNEFRQLYGSSTLPAATFVDQVYENVLHRPAEQSGHDYWVGQIDGGMSEAEVLARFADSPENRADVIGAISDGIWLNLEGDYS